jgi:hypothetical protein
MPCCVCLQASKPFSFCTHSWIYDPASKSRILQLENQMQQLEAFEQSMLGVSVTYLSLSLTSRHSIRCSVRMSPQMQQSEAFEQSMLGVSGTPASLSRSHCSHA